MKRPDKEDNMFWFEIEKLNGETKELIIYFNHALYEHYLELYCDEIENKLAKNKKYILTLKQK